MTDNKEIEKDRNLLEDDLRASGSERFIDAVYLIGFTCTNKVYIGSTERWPERRRKHFRELELGVHVNSYLQKSYNKYGGKFCFCILLDKPIVNSTEELRRVEQKWIDFYNANDPRFGYNLVQDVIHPGTSGYKYTEEQRKALSAAVKQRILREKLNLESERCELYNPNGELIKIDNLYQFCLLNNYDYRGFKALKNDEFVQFLGWKKHLDRKHRKRRYYKFIDPEGELIEGYNLAEYCRINNLSEKCMNNLCNGELKTHAGYRRFDLTEEQAKTNKGRDYILINPVGEEIFINNLRKFCTINELSFDCLRKGRMHKGWKVKKKYDKNE